MGLKREEFKTTCLSQLKLLTRRKTIPQLIPLEKNKGEIQQSYHRQYHKKLISRRLSQNRIADEQARHAAENVGNSRETPSLPLYSFNKEHFV